MTGLLRVEGSVDLSQFWPDGDSDADTTKVLVQVDAGSFTYRADGSRSFKRSNVFDTAVVRGTGRRPAIKTNTRTGISTVTIRLQGIDAPELHYRPVFPTVTGKAKPSSKQRGDFNAANDELRQPYGETCTVQLHKTVACEHHWRDQVQGRDGGRCAR